MAILILLTDSKFFTATANIGYVLGIILMMATFVVGKDINGSKSWIPLGFFNLQPVETCKIFAALALSKYLSRTETDFEKPRSQLIAAAIVLTPAVFSILQNETGLALVYFAFLIPMYREGLPPVYLIIGFSFAVLVVATILVEKNTLAIILTVIAAATVYFLRRNVKRDKTYPGCDRGHLDIMRKYSKICRSLYFSTCFTAIPGRKNFKHVWSGLYSQ